MTDKFPDIGVGEMLTSGVVVPMEAGGTIVKGQAVKLTGDLKVELAESGESFGIAVTSATAGEQVSVCVFGIVKVTAAEEVLKNQAVKCASGGKVAVLDPVDQAVDEGGVATYTIAYDVQEKLGTAIQTADAGDDTFLIFVGK